jgi:hypothetical protein
MGTYILLLLGGGDNMPTLSIFFGIFIRMFYDEHAPPHFHAEYGGEKAVFNIQTLEVMEGKLSRRAVRLVQDWAELHQQELLDNWEKAHSDQPLQKIEPLK